MGRPLIRRTAAVKENRAGSRRNAYDQTTLTQFSTPGIKLPRTDRVFARHLARGQFGPEALSHNLALLLQRPTPPALAPRDNLHSDVVCALTICRMSALIRAGSV